MSGPTRALAEFAATARFADLPAAVLDVSRMAILDVLGTGVAARDEPLVAPLLGLATPVAGGAPIVGRQERTSPLMAALVNGTLCHALDFDDTYQPVPIHPSTSLVPALLAASHGRRVAGADFLAAYAVACEAAIRIGLGAGRSHVNRGWHGTGTFGTFGAAAGAGRLRGLSADAMAAALGMAAVQAAGLLTVAAGTMSKPLHAGKAAMNGFLAAALAAGGFTAPAAVLEQRQGFLSAYSDGPVLDAVTAGLGSEWRLLDLSFKLYACCSQTHAVIDAARALRRSGATDLAGIDEIVIEANPVAAIVAGIPRPERGLEGKFSLAYTAVASLLGQTMTPETFTDAAVSEPAVQAACRRVTVQVTPAYGDTEAALAVRLRNGKELREYVPVARGNPGNPCRREEMDAKFLALASPALGRERAVRLRDVVRSLESLADVSTLVELTSPASPRAESS